MTRSRAAWADRPTGASMTRRTRFAKSFSMPSRSRRRCSALQRSIGRRSWAYHNGDVIDSRRWVTLASTLRSRSRLSPMAVGRG